MKKKCLKARPFYQELDREFILLTRRPSLRIYNRFMSIIRFLLHSGFLMVDEYEFLVLSARSVYES